MIEMELFKIKINERSNIQTIILKEKSGKRLLSIGVGIPEINAIKLKVIGAMPPRPLTHDLLNNVIKQLDARIEKIIIDKLECNTFYAKIILQTGNGGAKKIDARPSDSIALALRAKAPIFIVEDVLDTVATFSE